MQSYNNLNECIKMCDRILRTNTYPRGAGFAKSEIRDFQPAEVMKSNNAYAAGYQSYDYLSKSDNIQTKLYPDANSGRPIQTSEKINNELLYLNSVNNFYPSRTIVVQNFLPEAEVHVRSFVATFGIVEICEIIRDDALSCVAVVQYKSKTSAADALLAIPYCQVRGGGLSANLLWDGPWERLCSPSGPVPRECAERRSVCVGRLPRGVSEERARRTCERFGRVESARVRPQEKGAFVFAVFRSPLSAAVAVYCLRNRTTTSAALVLGYSENGSPALVGPVRVRPLDQYGVPLSAFDVRCICTRFLDYSRMKGHLVNLQRKLPLNHFFWPGSPDYCVRLPASGVKEISLFLEILLFKENFLKNADEITDLAYQFCSHKYLFRFSIDFGLHKPILTHDERMTRPAPPYLRWNAFFILDLQVCFPWGHPEPAVESNVQSMNHIYSDLDSRAFDDDWNVSSWFGISLRHSTCNLTPSGMSGDDLHHRNKMKFLMDSNLPFVRLVGDCESVNAYQLPIHVFSDSQSNLKQN